MVWVDSKILSGIFNILMTDITKEKLVEILRGLLETDADLGFLMRLKKTEIETLVACIRNRVEDVGK